jgi:hypothetical protein
MREIEALATRYKSGEVIVYNQLVMAYNQLHTMTNEIRLDVESRLCKIRRGSKPWSPKLQIYRDTIELWDWAVKFKLGVKTSRTELFGCIYMNGHMLTWQLHRQDIRRLSGHTIKKKQMLTTGVMII